MKNLILSLTTLVACVALAAPAAKPGAAPDYAQLAQGPWQPRAWSGREFAFVAYPFGAGGIYHVPERGDRIGHEFEAQKLVTLTWKDATFIEPGGGVGEWDWGAHGFLSAHDDIRAHLASAGKRACYYWFKTYHQVRSDENGLHARPRPQADKTKKLSMPGHYNFACYGAQWGADMVGQEIAENIIATQCKLAVLRGAARQNGIPWFIDVSQWYSSFGHWARNEPGDASSVPVYMAGQKETDPVGSDVKPAAELTGNASSYWNGGHSPSFLARCWMASWLSGVAILQAEANGSNFFAYDPALRDAYLQDGKLFVPKDPGMRAALSPIGKRAQQFMALTQKHPDRGITYTPFAVLLDEYAGFAGNVAADQHGFDGTAERTCPPRPWGVLEPTWGDREIYLFFDTVFPDSMYLDTLLGRTHDTADEARRLVASPYGDTFDVQLTSASEEMLAAYPVLICVGDHELLPETVAKLKTYVKNGGHLCLTHALAAQLGPALDELKQAGCVETFGITKNQLPFDLDVTRWYLPFLPKASDAEIAARREALKLQPYELAFKQSVVGMMDALAADALPLKVAGKVEYILNRTATGWVIGLINNEGITKTVFNPVQVDPSKQQVVNVTWTSGAISSAAEWCTDQPVAVQDNRIQITVPPGEVRIVEVVAQK